MLPRTIVLKGTRAQFANLPMQLVVFELENEDVISTHIVKQTKSKNYSTGYSRVVPHRSTDPAIACLTLGIGRDPVLSSVYGRSYRLSGLIMFITYNLHDRKQFTIAKRLELKRMSLGVLILS